MGVASVHLPAFKALEPRHSEALAPRGVLRSLLAAPKPARGIYPHAGSRHALTGPGPLDTPGRALFLVAANVALLAHNGIRLPLASGQSGCTSGRVYWCRAGVDEGTAFQRRGIRVYLPTWAGPVGLPCGGSLLGGACGTRSDPRGPWAARIARLGARAGRRPMDPMRMATDPGHDAARGRVAAGAMLPSARAAQVAVPMKTIQMGLGFTLAGRRRPPALPGRDPCPGAACVGRSARTAWRGLLGMRLGADAPRTLAGKCASACWAPSSPMGTGCLGRGPGIWWWRSSTVRARHAGRMSDLPVEARPELAIVRGVVPRVNPVDGPGQLLGMTRPLPTVSLFRQGMALARPFRGNGHLLQPTRDGRRQRGTDSPDVREADQRGPAPRSRVDANAGTGRREGAAGHASDTPSLGSSSTQPAGPAFARALGTGRGMDRCLEPAVRPGEDHCQGLVDGQWVIEGGGAAAGSGHRPSDRHP
ncbi:hypothetical protein H696_02751 [Fonticula alba]|uniref:Uncharacterized protein n=1 Tax=Fonticula alba TaxID=691883 RepID=A0A058Z812_FONAL|nr:hypothetical protein H696_02751 [Fonticula alba]KCV70410.1 hypothetical protein H696_02751 [Fonticula alba]|eukprot:XP_009494926.1 hypothetical protein H696_02751 [Fonticula alba]